MLAEVRGRDFVAETVRIDGRRFVDCRFEACRLAYGGEEAALENCTLVGCSWRLEGAAATTVRLLNEARDLSTASEPRTPSRDGDVDTAEAAEPPRPVIVVDPLETAAAHARSAIGGGGDATPDAGTSRSRHAGWLADYAEWAVVAAVSAALLLVVFVRSVAG
jgi:hypothetical protein